MYTYMYITFFISIYVNQIRRPPAVANAGRRLGRGESQSLVRHICDWLLLMCKLVSMKVPSLAISRCFRPSVCWFFFRSCYRDFSAFNGDEVSSSILLLLRLPESCCLWVFPAVRLFAFCAFSVATMWAVPRKVFRRSKVTFIGCRKIASSQPLVAFSFLA